MYTNNVVDKENGMIPGTNIPVPSLIDKNNMLNNNNNIAAKAMLNNNNNNNNKFGGYVAGGGVGGAGVAAGVPSARLGAGLAGAPVRKLF